MVALDWLPASEYPFEHRFIDLEGDRIHYVDEGAGPAMLLVNVGEWSFISPSSPCSASATTPRTGKLDTRGRSPTSAH